jgi:hypothetical protein
MLCRVTRSIQLDEIGKHLDQDGKNPHRLAINRSCGRRPSSREPWQAAKGRVDSQFEDKPAKERQAQVVDPLWRS